VKLIYVPCRDEEEAQKITRTLLEEKLIGCANLFPIKSMYWWEGKIENTSEHITLLKTNDSLVEKVRQRVKEIHSYDVPAIIVINADVNKEYLDWLNSNLH